MISDKEKIEEPDNSIYDYPHIECPNGSFYGADRIYEHVVPTLRTSPRIMNTTGRVEHEILSVHNFIFVKILRIDEVIGEPL